MSDALPIERTPTPLATRRVNKGRGHVYLLDGSPADGVTTVIGEGIPKPALIGWAANTTAAYAVDNWDELATVGVAARLERLKKARWEDSDAAARRGTEVHAFAQRLMAGQSLDVPEELVDHVDAYIAFDADWKVEESLVEVVIVNRRHRYMGTLDMVATLKDGLTWLLDWKTTRSGVYPENALQLAAYRNAETYLGADAQEYPMPAIDRCGVVWLRADGYDLVPCDLEDPEETFRTFLYAQQVAQWRAKPREEVIGEALSA